MSVVYHHSFSSSFRQTDKHLMTRKRKSATTAGPTRPRGARRTEAGPSPPKKCKLGPLLLYDRSSGALGKTGFLEFLNARMPNLTEQERNDAWRNLTLDYMHNELDGMEDVA